MRKSMLTVIILIVALLAAACGSSGPKTSSSHPKTTPSSGTKPKVVVKTATIKPYGTVLVNSAGHALYVFAPDKATKVTCTSACQKIWPPLAQPSDAKVVSAGAVKASLIGADTNPSVSGGRVVTYNHWPLYAYTADTAPGVAHGQALKLNGGYWYVISPSGTVIKSKKSSSSSSSSSSPYG